MDLNKRIGMLRDAQELLHQARELIEIAVEGTRSEGMTKAYITPQLEILASSDHSWLDDSHNIDKVIDAVQEEYDEEVEA